MKIAVLEDHKVYAESFKTFLEINDDVDLVEIFINIDEFENAKKNYDIAILDLDINGNSSLYLVKKYRELKFLILSASDNQNLIRMSYEDGVFGYLNKRVGPKRLFDSIKKIVFDHEKVYDINIITQSFKKDNRINQKLTPREIEIVELLFKDHSVEYIADQLHISKNTVKTHKQKIFKKLGIKSTSEVKYKYLFK